MITSLVVKNYQSLASAELELGRFTLLTGPTGVGKSALFRAFRLPVFNARGTSYISRGAKTCMVELADDSEGWAVAIERGSRGNDSYQVILADGAPRSYTKLAGKVPAEASLVLGLSDLNFAGQLDRPYLLDASGSEVAKALGLLTGVTLIFDAAREANRRRLRLEDQLKDARAELAHLTERAQGFRGLKARQQAAAGAAAAYESFQLLGARCEGLARLITRVQSAQAALAAVQVPEAPDISRLDALAARRTRLASLVANLRDQEQSLGIWTAEALASSRREHEARLELVAALEAAGVCPTCGQQVHPR